MKNILLLMVLLIQSSAELGGLDELNWLVGTWERTDIKPGKQGFEVWELEDSNLTGRGISMKGADTTFVEILKIESIEGQLFYVAEVPQNPNPTPFKIVDLRANYFKCENPAHDFPEVITYERKGDELQAIISGDGQSMSFSFQKID
jgi:hypothetical protein